MQPPCLIARRFLATLTAAVVFLSTQWNLRGENIPLDHPVVELVKKYLGAVVAQDWTAAASMLLPTSLERKQRETIAIVKMAPTMTEENAMLDKLGAREIRDLEKMTPQEFYVADRTAVHQKMNISPEVKKRKQETLKINILGLAGEDENRVLHATVRTSQETLDAKIEEIFLISLVQDKDDTNKWLIVPDMMRPITTPLKEAEPASAPSKEEKTETAEKKDSKK